MEVLYMYYDTRADGPLEIQHDPEFNSLLLEIMRPLNKLNIFSALNNYVERNKKEEQSFALFFNVIKYIYF